MTYAIFFLSGISALVFQHIWFRQAGLVFGNSVWASSLVLSSFMAGLALGNGVATLRRAGKRSALLTYAALELTVALTGVLLVFVFPALGEDLLPALSRVSGGGLGLGAIRFTIAFILLLIPSAAMGMTLPVLAARAPSRELFGVTLGRLYGWNTLGAFVGALSGEGFLYAQVGIRGAAFVAGGLNVAAALLAMALARTEGRTDAPPAEERSGRPSGAEMRLLLVAALSGGSFLALEVIWTRFMQLFVFGNALSFAIMLALALAGMAIGSLLASRSPRACTAPEATPILALMASLAVTASYASFVDVLKIDLHSAPGGLWTRVAVLSAGLILPVAIVSGALFNCVGVALGDQRSARGATGLLTLSNTLGATIGAMVAGFVLLPVLGMERSFWCVAAIYVAAALICPGFVPLVRRSRWLAAATVAGLLFTVLFPRGLMASTYLRQAMRPFLSGAMEARVTGFREGLTETITYVDSMFQGEPLYTRLITNSFSMSGTMFSGRRYMEAFVYLPVAIHPRVRSALLISYGVGSTARALVETREIERIDVVDISKDILEMAPLSVLPGETAPLADPRVHTHIEDGRFFLETTGERYDLITSEPPPPHLGGVVNLYTRQYFELMKRRLNPNGIVSYWLPVHSLSDDDSRAITSAFCSAFEDCTLFKGLNLDWILIGTQGLMEPVSLERFKQQWSATGPRGPREVGLEVPEQLGALFMAEGASMPDLTSRPPLDDNYPGRLSRAPPAQLLLGEWKQSLMDPAAGRQRFLSSSFIRRVWPEHMRDATLPYFDVQRLYDRMVHELVPGGETPNSPKDALPVLRTTSLSVLPSILLGTTGEMRSLARRLEMRDGPDPNKAWLLAHLATMDLGERRYDEAAARYRRSLSLDPNSPGTRERLVLALCLAGKTREAGAERESIRQSSDTTWTELLNDACGEGRREPTDAR